MTGFACPHCNCTVSIVTDSRFAGGEKNRRRQCKGCGKRWTTVELSRDRVTKLERMDLTAGEQKSLVTALRLLERIVGKSLTPSPRRD